jgi:WD40 repeat protein
MKTTRLLLQSILIVLVTTLNSQTLAVYVSDAAGFNSGPFQIAKFDENGNYEGSLITVDDGIVRPQDIVFLDDEEAVLISNLAAAGVISKHHWATGNLIENFAEGLGGPTRMKLGPDGKLYVLQWSNTVNKVLRFELDGTPLGDFTSAGVSQSIGIDWDANGDLYVSSYGGSFIQKFDGTTGADLGPFINNGLQGPTNIFFEPDGNLIVFNYNSGIIKRFDSSGNFVEDVITGVNGCEGFAFFPNGDLLIGVGSDGSVRRYDSDYNFIENFVEPNTDLITPNAIVIREDIPLSVPETALNITFVTPSAGSQFKISDQAAAEYPSLKVFDTIGRLIDTLVPEVSMYWDASKLTEGIYFITASKNGQKSTQKIVVKKS